MWRSFLTLYGVVLSALLLSYLAISIPVSRYIDGLVQDEAEVTTSGIFFLLEREFKGVKREDYPQVIARLNRLFPYGVGLLTESEVADLDLSAAATAALERGHIALRRNPYQMMLKRLAVGGPVLKVNWETDPEQENQMLAAGPLHLINQGLASIPQQKWPAAIAKLQTHFEFPIAIVRKQEPGLGDAVLRRIEQGEIVTQNTGGDAETLFARMLDSDYLLKAGPLKNEIWLNEYYLMLIPVVVVALGVLLWVMALGRDAKKLNRTTRLFGQGALDTRVALGRHSALAETGARFNAMAADIQGLIEGSRELTNAVSHDLKTPLSRMRFALEMLQEKVADPEAHRLKRSLEGDVEELENMIEELLANARYERQLSLHREPIRDLFVWVEGLVERLARQYPKIQLELVNSMALDTEVALDRKAMARTLRNVVGNALRYARLRLRIEVRVADGVVGVTIEDDGPGIPEADRERVLKPFIRLERSREYRGHGLGLAIAARVMMQHRGGIDISRSRFGGAQVRLYWPAGLGNGLRGAL